MRTPTTKYRGYAPCDERVIALRELPEAQGALHLPWLVEGPRKRDSGSMLQTFGERDRKSTLRSTGKATENSGNIIVVKIQQYSFDLRNMEDE